jgi:hypothetical protein
MNTAMQMPMMNMMPMPMNMMGGMMPMQMPMGMNGMMPMMMCKMTMKMTANGMTCEMMPMDPAMKDAFMACCQQMMNMCQMGMPMMMACGGMSMMGMCTPAKA